MTVKGARFVVAGGTELVDALDERRLVLRCHDELQIFDVDEGAITLRRAIEGLRYVRVYGDWIQVEDKKGTGLIGGDLEGTPLRWDSDLSLVGIVGKTALLSSYDERARLPLSGKGKVSKREKNERVSWSTAHAEAGLFLGVREHKREIVALHASDGKVVWTTRPFEGKLDSIGRPVAHGKEVHVRAKSGDHHHVARLTATDGASREVRAGSVGVDPWLPDLGEEVDAKAHAFASSQSLFYIANGLVIPQSDQLIIVEPKRTMRVAAPTCSWTAAGRRVAAIRSDRTRIELITFRLPEKGEHDLVLEPAGADSDGKGSSSAENGTVSFVGKAAPIVIVQHPKYGRVTLTRSDDSLPEIVAQVVLDGVEVKPGGVVSVERWWVAGATAARKPEHHELHDAQLRPAPKPLTAILPALKKRAKAAGVTIPSDVKAFIEKVDREPALRTALARLGYHFEEDELEMVDEFDVEDFVPLWSNGFGDGYGGFTSRGLAYFGPKDDDQPQPLAALHAYLKKELANADEEAAAETVLAALAR